MRRDVVMAKLLERNSDGLVFVAATSEVVRGLDLARTGGRRGTDVFVGNLGPPEIPDSWLETGVMIRIGAREKFPGGELKCLRERNKITVALYDKKGRAFTRVLSCRAAGDEIDEGRLAFIGPMEDLGTAWSDNDPVQCQVVTVERLRRVARATPKRKKKARRVRR